MSATKQSADARRAFSEGQLFPPLEQVTRPTVPSEQAAHYLLRRQQTWRMKACYSPELKGLAPLRICGRLAGPAEAVKHWLGCA